MKKIEKQIFDMERALCGKVTDTKLYGIKALRECSRMKMQGCDIVSPDSDGRYRRSG